MVTIRNCKVLLMGVSLAVAMVASAQDVRAPAKTAKAKADAEAVVAQSRQVEQSVKGAAEAAANQAGTARTAAGDRNAKFMEDASQSATDAINDGLKRRGAERGFYEQKERVDQELAAKRAWFEEQQKRAAGISEQSLDEMARKAGVPAEKGRPSYMVLISQSMGIDGIKAALEFGRGRKDVAYAFRGFKPGQDPKGFYMQLVQLAGKDEDRLANIMLDPPAFRDNQVTVVPTILYLDKSERVVAQVRGVANPDWMKRQIEGGAKGDLGKVGTTYAIAEEDLIEVMKAKVASINLEEQKRQAAQNYFNEMSVIGLPYAETIRRRELLAQMVVKSDVVDPDGVVRYHAGQVVSMRDEMPNAPVLVIFNSQDPYHVAFAKSIVARYPTKNVILMTTAVDRTGGFSNYIKQERAIGRPVYLLTAEVKSTFGIEKIPTLVKPLDDRFAIVEVPLKQGAR
jgi:conjugal transfer pilus assembly protein TraW